jgi:hypothetical protein
MLNFLDYVLAELCTCDSATLIATEDVLDSDSGEWRSENSERNTTTLKPSVCIIVVN